MMGFLLKNQNKTVPKETCWEVKLDTVSDCGKAPESIEVSIAPLVKVKIERLMERFENIEWLAYLVGENTNITDIYIPKQKVSAGSVDDIDSSVCNRLPIIGVIHSHHGMGNGFSGTDNNWINQNNDISLCISKEGINGQMRWKTPCGSLKIVKAVVRLKIDVDYDKEKFEEIIDTNIKKAVSVFPKDIMVDHKNNTYSNFVNYNDDDENIDKYLKTLDLNLEDEKTLEEELAYIEDSGMFPDEDDKGDDIDKNCCIA
jgi:hypothetical protein